MINGARVALIALGIAAISVGVIADKNPEIRVVTTVAGVLGLIASAVSFIPQCTNRCQANSVTPISI